MTSQKCIWKEMLELLAVLFISEFNPPDLLLCKTVPLYTYFVLYKQPGYKQLALG